jgi:hypothetical protein
MRVNFCRVDIVVTCLGFAAAGTSERRLRGGQARPPEQGTGGCPQIVLTKPMLFVLAATIRSTVKLLPISL